jgi:DNA-binding NarL/FixJ family response regulator
VQVIVAEDSVLLQAGLGRLLTDEGIEVHALVDTPKALIEAFEAHPVDLCIVDVRMPPTFTDEGIQASVDLRNRWPGTPVLVLSQYVEERYATELLADNPSGLGYLLKDRVADVGEFFDAVRRVANGGTALDPDVVSQLLVRSRPKPVDELTPREREVLALMAEGRSNPGIARRLVVSDGAVEKHVSNIFNKLGLPPTGDDHRRVLAVLAYLEGE